MNERLLVYSDEKLADYSFGDGHPFGRERYFSFHKRFSELGLDKKTDHAEAHMATDAQILLFHTTDYLEKVKTLSASGSGYLDYGDTPAFKGIYEAAARVVGTVIDGIDSIMSGQYARVFVPIAGLHHARRHQAAGFCALNDCGIAIEYLRHQYGIKRVAYVDIDAHHGDGVFYSFEDDPDLLFADLHENGIYLYPGTGHLNETGKGKAAGTKLNIPMPMQANDVQFSKAWLAVEKYLEQRQPEIILFQCGADSIEGDPITHMNYSPESHAHAATSLRAMADKHCNGRLLAMGGGGYNLENIANAWCKVVEALV